MQKIEIGKFRLRLTPSEGVILLSRQKKGDCQEFFSQELRYII